MQSLLNDLIGYSIEVVGDNLKIDGPPLTDSLRDRIREAKADLIEHYSQHTTACFPSAEELDERHAIQAEGLEASDISFNEQLPRDWREKQDRVGELDHYHQMTRCRSDLKLNQQKLPCGCGSRWTVDTPSLTTEAVYRDCAGCGSFIEFARWRIMSREAEGRQSDSPAN